MALAFSSFLLIFVIFMEFLSLLIYTYSPAPPSSPSQFNCRSRETEQSSPLRFLFSTKLCLHFMLELAGLEVSPISAFLYVLYASLAIIKLPADLPIWTAYWAYAQFDAHIHGKSNRKICKAKLGEFFFIYAS